MSSKSSTVMARVEPEIKEQAERILAELGVSASGLINMLYRQVIYQNGIPFSVTIPQSIPSIEDMPESAMDAMLKKGLEQAMEGRGVSLEEAFAELEDSIR